MKQGSFKISAGKLAAAYERALRKADKAEVVQQLMTRRARVFTRDARVEKLIANRLGWVDLASSMRRQVAGIEKFGEQVLADGIRHVVLMGMGGSSLCPELFKLVHRRHPRLKSFDVIDSTDPRAVKAVARKVELKKTLFIVASKSGGTVETRSHEAYFAGLLREVKGQEIGRHFVVITDKGSGLEKSARKNRYRKIFINPSDVGGRYSALSFFGLVPGFFAGVDLRALLDDALMMQKLLLVREGETNPALALGALMAATATAGRDKLTFVASKKTAPLVPWIEQLVAESTGKKKKGVVPIENEPVGRVEVYKNDRLFVFVRMATERTPNDDRLKASLREMHFPVIEITLGSRAELGRMFLLWETATAVTGYLLGINPFDEPNVTESKSNTNEILAGFERSGEFPDQHPQSRWGKLWLVAYEKSKKYRMGELNDISRFLKRYFAGARRPKYFAALNYFAADRRTEAALARIRREVRDRTGMATLRGYGPRFLHSIGQLYKGGPAEGMFVVFVKNSYGRLPIPGRFFDFGQLIAAQAIGDSRALMDRRLPTLVIAIDGSPADGLETFARAVRSALKQRKDRL